MLDDLENILTHTADRQVFQLALLLKQEVQHRLAFEEAVRDYLRDAGANPFSSSRRLLEFLEGELRQEPGLVPAAAIREVLVVNKPGTRW